MYMPIWNAVEPHLSVERMQAEIAELFAFSRWSSFDKINALARQIADKMEAAGMEDVRLIQFPADGRTAYGGWVMPKAYDVHAARLTAHIGNEPEIVLADYNLNPTSLMLYSLPTPPEGITAELVVADALPEFTAQRLSGRLALTSGIGVEYSLAAMRAGAWGVVSDCRNAWRFIKDGPEVDRTNEWHNYTIPPWDDPQKGFGFAISPEQGRMLRAKIAAGQTVRLHVCVQTTHYDGVLPVISGLLRGQKREEIVLTGHYDEFGADDNCSQVTVALEAIRILRVMLQAGEIPPLQRSIRILFPMEVRGFNALIQNDAETRQMRVGLNIDTVGTDQNRATTICNLSENFPAQPSFAEEFVIELLRRIAQENPLFRWRRAPAEMIDDILGEPLIGAPTPSLWHASADHHLATDTPDRISSRMLHDMTRLTATYAGFLANAGLPEALWLAELVADRGVQRLQETETDALRGRDAIQVAALPDRLRALHAAYRRRLGSARWIVPVIERFPDAETVAQQTAPLLGESALVPQVIYAERVAGLAERLDHALEEAEGRVRHRAEEFFQVRLPTEEPPVPVSRSVPIKTFRGFASFETLSKADQDTLRDTLDVRCSWGAPMWLQNALMFANGKRTAGEIAVLLRQHGGPKRDVDNLEKVFAFLAAQGMVRFRPYLTQTDVQAALQQAGLTAGDVVLGHFSLSRFGYIEGGAESLITTLLQILGPSGTLLMPTFTFSWFGRRPHDPAKSPSRVGQVTDHFWRREGVLRSAHPTHSFAGIGPQAAFLLEGNDHTQSPLSRTGPLGKLADLDAKILLFGPLETNTSMHAGDYWTGIPMPDFVCPILEEGVRREVLVPDCPWHARFGTAYEKLYARGQVCDVPLGEGTIHTLRSRDAIAAQAEVAREQPEALLAPGCECPYCQRLKQYIDREWKAPG
jgi:aminoglycoside 3-N-acetyltransferase